MKLVVNAADVEVGDRHAKTPLPWVLGDIGLHEATFRSGARFCASAPLRPLRKPSAQPRLCEGERR
jgi:hypothetical protein